MSAPDDADKGREQDASSAIIPRPDWSTGALLEAALGSGPHKLEAGTVGHMCAVRLQQIAGVDTGMDPAPGPRCFIVMTGTGFWARGTSIHQAAKACAKAGAARTSMACAYLILNDPTPEVDGAGWLVTAPGSSIQVQGVIRTIGALIRAGDEA